MALPKLETPSYELTLPSTDEKIRYRPFLVKEYKILLTALESDSQEIHRIVTELVDACTFNKLDIKKLASFDIEFLFLNIRARSIGETANLTLKCKNCEHDIDIEMDITKAHVQKNPEHTKKIMISEDVGIEMRYPKFEETIEIYENLKTDKIVDLLCSCISAVFTKEEYIDSYTREELMEFVNSFSKEQFDKLEKFFVTMPRVVQDLEKECPKCGTHNDVKLEGLQNFFV